MDGHGDRPRPRVPHPRTPGDGEDGVRAVHERLGGSRVGRRWERIARTHAPEIMALLAVHPELDARVRTALWLVERAARRTAEPVDDATVAALATVLGDLDRLGTLDLRRDAQALRDELEYVRGHSLAELLAG